ncbi:endochitinase A2-like [Typha angustifolia]|uniref:endochitinase A2-like n=1 Tax=Typha angustifolia TaxID=59011 RepID=UPI003C2B9B77
MRPPGDGQLNRMALMLGVTGISKSKLIEETTALRALTGLVLQARNIMAGDLFKSPTTTAMGRLGKLFGSNLLSNPDLVATDATISFKTALWFSMTPQSPKPSCHAVITGQWTPSTADVSANRLPGFGVTTNIINGGAECGLGEDNRVKDRIGFCKRYCDILGVGYGNNLDCFNQRSLATSVDVMK